MKLVKTKIGELTRTVTGGELLEATINYEVTNANGDLTYKGPKIPRELWHQIVSFLKWANDQAKSEAQVRLFVSAKHSTWAAWAFPQEGYTGLASKEIQDDAFRQQRSALFEHDADWFAWGTVHSHAAIGAFQSGTDEADEENQGGLHITVGNLDDRHYSFHARLYHQKDMYEPDMSLFWDIGEPFKGLDPTILLILPELPADKLARIQMCIPVAIEFPEQWKLNYRKPVTQAAQTRIASGNGTFDGGPEWKRWNCEQQFPDDVGPKSPFYQRVAAAVVEVKELDMMYCMDEGGVLEVVQYMSQQVPDEIASICRQYNLSAADILHGLLKAGKENKSDPMNGQPGID